MAEIYREKSDYNYNIITLLQESFFNEILLAV